MNELFEDGDYYTGPPLSNDMILHAEDSLGLRLPEGYVSALSIRNGGVLKRRCFPTEFTTSWAADHFEVRALLGVGGTWGIDSSSGLGSADSIAEWGYPDVGVVICDMPSGGHDVVMLDYSQSGPYGEPSVAYVDEDRIPRTVAGSFEEFLARLIPYSSPI
ncbi:1,3-beta-glucan synthase regulator [Actinoalloteichus sp. AHMU CJ021]|uniref:SMI1/KNR4 family protein n=1 Tax=Actinoalloteichus sp. AHMU CJ021 TaxID=2072503 RepID=UPI000CA06C3E|nr:1,3-beta-glucan synthase regulator [Actinoalloteichus sp. AHMU CJ021]